MATKKLNPAAPFTIDNKYNRNFSEQFKEEKVKDLLDKRISIKQLCDLWQVSRVTAYKWLYKYSPHHSSGTKMVVQMESEAHKTLQLLQRVAELERIVGQKQLEIDFLNKLMEVATEELGYDLKKTPLRSCRVVPLQPVGPRPPDEGRLPTVRHQQAVAPPGAQAGEGP